MLSGALRRFVTEDFKGALGAFTPCFIDVVVLGAPIFVALYIGCNMLHQVNSFRCGLWPQLLQRVKRVM